jgi:hydroxypyruvate isomerase
MSELAANIETLFTEADDFADRVRAAAAAGFTAVEMWQSSTKDIPSIKRALDENDVRLVAQLAEPRIQFMIPPRDDSVFLNGLEQSVEDAAALGNSRLIVQSGTGFGGRTRQSQLEELIEIYRKGIDHIEGSGIELVLEPLNTRVDHPGTLIDRTLDGISVVRGVDSPQFGLLYDLYHSEVEGEDVDEAICAAAGLIRYVQIADAPGRGEPGTGNIDFENRLNQLSQAEYSGPIGLEFRPTRSTEHWLNAVRGLGAWRGEAIA